MKYIKTSVKFLTTSTTFTSSFDKKIRNINRNETPCSNVNTATYQRNSTCKGIVKIHTLQITTIKQNLYTFTTLPVSAQLRYQTNRDSCNRSKRTIHPVLWSSITCSPAGSAVDGRGSYTTREILKILTASLNGTETNMCQAHLPMPVSKREQGRERINRWFRFL